jgi:TPR repeat protein
MTIYNSINDIEKKFNINIIVPSKYHNTILEMFNSENIETTNFNSTNSFELYLIGLYFQYEKKDYIQMIKYYKKSAESKNIFAMYNLAKYYHYTNCDYRQAVIYYVNILNILDKLNTHENQLILNLIIKIKTMFNLGYFYQHNEKNNSIMKKYYFELLDLLANCSDLQNLTNSPEYEIIKKIKSKTSFNLGYYYQYSEPNYLLMKRYYLIAMNLFNSKASNNLGLYYQHVEQNYLKMIEYYIKSIKLENQKALINLELFYKKNNQLKSLYNLLKKLESNKIITNKLNELEQLEFIN